MASRSERTAGKDGARLRTQVRVLLGADIALGPGKADLLEAIRDTGSISAAARRMGMSYRRAWLLADTMNRCFREPLIEAATGGRSGGGARLTRTGAQVLKQYRELLRAMEKAGGPASRVLLAQLRRHARPGTGNRD
jgi:molybdate transport system regulatory protein